MSNSPTILVAVQTLRSFNQALSGMSSDQESVANWIRRYAESDSRSSTFPKDAAIGLLSHLQNPIFANANLTSEQQAWSGLMSSAEQMLQEENNWIGQKSAQQNATTFTRMFGSDLTWIQLFAQANSVPSHWTNEYMINYLITELRSCQGSTGAGAIPHTALSPNVSQNIP